MLEHELPVAIGAPKSEVWSYVSNMANWAGNLPGYRAFEVLNDTDSLWTLKVGVGALVRTVKVRVHVTVWREPDRVDFTYRLEGDPVDGAGSYRATTNQDGGTDVVLTVQINGQGPMAPAWEAMARPILPKFAKGFGDSLRAEIESIVGKTTPPEVGPFIHRPLDRKVGLLRRMWRRVTGIFEPA
ncbi:MAG: polyketide cyclase / dehydrase and lipid transport family protein [Sphingomonas bacterium]|jgi:carbon monoxide dehydrogenase subunit G|uniref:CoxG family protein n=1 Tax=Sphingomonas bacterium TaxID=1895847 RepID=UPI0026216CAB|nr:SRPBCC family protein [Sphingomonas bacterium]MDB5710738.1 polyketide cyclase / dehydrase and lipid transport family protein [Sphingomonas bacterium]